METGAEVDVQQRTSDFHGSVLAGNSDALLPTMGGQTALNTALDLVREGVLEKYEVELIAASRAAIDMAEDRELFRNAMREIGLETPHSQIARSLEEALAVAADIGYPVVVRPSFTLGGSGGGIAYNREELEDIVARGLDASPTDEVLIEESVLGWKEYELEVMRDATTTSSSSARSRTSTRWASTPATRSPSPRR